MRTAQNLLRLLGLAAALTLLTPLLYGHGTTHIEIAKLDEQIAKDPQNADLWLQRFYLHMTDESWEEALKDCTRAEEIDPDAAAFPFLRARAHYQGEAFTTARKLLDGFIDAHPDHLEALLLRGRVATAQNDFTTACADFDAAIPRLETAFPAHFIEQAAAHAKNPATGPAVALQRLDAGMERIGKIVTLLDEAVTIEIDRGNIDGAVARLGDLMTTTKYPARWLIEKGHILARADRPDEAAAAYREALAAIAAMPERVAMRPAYRHYGTMIEEALAKLTER